MNNVTLIEVMKNHKRSVASSTAMFNDAYWKAESVFLNQKRTAPKDDRSPERHTDLSKLYGALKYRYEVEAPSVLADWIVAQGDDMNPMDFVNELGDLVKWNDMVNAARDRCAKRLGWTASSDDSGRSKVFLPLMTLSFEIKNDSGADIMKHRFDDVESLLEALMDKELQKQFLVQWSAQLGKDTMMPVVDVAEDCQGALDDVKQRVRVKAVKRSKGKNGASRTDRLIMGTARAPLTVFMSQHVLNRYLEACVKETVYTEKGLERQVESMSKAIKEAGGMDGLHRDKKVFGYSDLSKNENQGYCNPAEIDNIRNRYLDGDDEKDIVGITALEDKLGQLKDLEAAVLASIANCHRLLLDSGRVSDCAPATYLYVKHGEMITPITDRGEAVYLLEKSRNEFIDKLKRESALAKEDAARYDAMWHKIPEFEISEL